jgi:uncharacterized protein YjiS (DUF1127 family)
MKPRVISAEAALLMPFTSRNDKDDEINRLVTEACQARDAALAARVSGFFHGLCDAIATMRHRRETIDELRRLSNRDLADIGISRAGIMAAAEAAIPANDRAGSRRAA